MYICVFVCHCLCEFRFCVSNKQIRLPSAAALPQWVTHSCSWAAQRDEQWDEDNCLCVFLLFWQALKDNKAFINTCK